jgi:diguanylate cyclase (GGDEF)-like protein/PAS domain S-box-containing protein
MTLDVLGDVSVLCTDRELRLTQVLGSAISDLGWDADLMVGRALVEALPIKQRDRLEAAFLAALDGEEEVLSLAASDRQAMFDFKVRPMRADGDDEKIAGVTAIVRQVAHGESAAARDERLGLLVDAVSDYAIFMLDPDGHVASWNPGAERVKGYRRKDIIGEHFSRFYLPEDVAIGKPDAQLEAARRKGRIEAEGWRVRKDGTRFWANDVITAVRDAEGQLLGFGKVTRELTERHKAEQALRESETRFRGLLEAAPDAIVIVDQSGIITLVNGQTETLLGYPREQLVGLPVELLLPQRLRDEHRALRTEFFSSPEVRAIGEGREVCALRHDGEELPVEIRLSPLRSDGGTLVSVAIRDVSARKAAERALRENRELLSGILGAAVDHAIIGCEQDGTVIVFNRGAEHMLGYRAEEVVGVANAELFHDPIEISVRAAELGVKHGFQVFVNAAADGRSETREWTYVRNDGSRLPVSLTVTPRRDTSGQIVGFMGLATDITQCKAAEERLRLAEDRFRTAFVNAPVGLALVSAMPPTLGRYLQVNRAMCELVGMSEAALLASDIQSLTLSDDRARSLEAVGDLLAGRLDHHQSEQRYLHATGHPIDVSVSLSLVRGADSAPMYFIAQVEDVGPRKRYERELQYMAGHDPLTGHYNRAHFLELLERHLHGIRRYGVAGAVLTVDLDHFKQINGRAGHGVGDQTISTVGRLIGARVRESDVIARLEGDEFVVLMHEGGEHEAETLASDMSDRIRAGIRIAIDADELAVTASIGVRVIDDAEATPEELMADSEEAMFAAKRAGRNRIALHVKQPTSQHVQPARMTLHNQIERALETDSFELHAQPVMRLRDQAVVKYELLLRMRTDDGTLLAPGTFLYVAERFGQVGRIDRWVVDRAVNLAIDERLDPAVELEINLSARSIGDRELLAFIERRIEASGVDPTRLVFEITETAAVESIQSAREFAEELRGLGCKFALDDFGAGFGSFYYLKHIPFDFLKIDGEFIRTATEGRTDQLIVQACVQLAKGLGKDTIAEFVETAETLRMLRALGVDFAQGFHVARPRPVDEAFAGGHAAIVRPPTVPDDRR